MDQKDCDGQPTMMVNRSLSRAHPQPTLEGFAGLLLMDKRSGPAAAEAWGPNLEGFEAWFRVVQRSNHKVSGKASEPSWKLDPGGVDPAAGNPLDVHEFPILWRLVRDIWLPNLRAFNVVLRVQCRAHWQSNIDTGRTGNSQNNALLPLVRLHSPFTNT